MKRERGYTAAEALEQFRNVLAYYGGRPNCCATFTGPEGLWPLHPAVGLMTRVVSAAVEEDGTVVLRLRVDHGVGPPV